MAAQLNVFMKVSFLIFLVLFTVNFSRAQFNKGETLLGGNFYVLNNSNNSFINVPNVLIENTKSFEVFLTPQIIHFFRDNTAVGLLTGFHSYKGGQGTQKFTNTGYDAGIFFKRYKFLHERIGLYGQGGANYAQSILKHDDIKTYRNSFASLQLRPGVVYRFTKHFSMEYVFGVAGVGRARTKHIESNTATDRTEFTVGFFDGFNVSAYYIFSKKKE